MNRPIVSITEAPEVLMGNIRLRQAFPTRNIEQLSPFILLHHFDKVMEPGEEGFYVPPHPHRGFSPVTFMYEGSVEHKDSIGNEKVIYKNEVQWINAGSGIIHSEKASKDFIAKGGRYQGIQLWINTESKNKMAPPYYLPVTREEMVIIESEGVEFRLVSGKFENHVGPAKSEAITAMLSMQKDSNRSFELPETNVSALYVLEGKLRINKHEMANAHDLIRFKNEAGMIELEALAETKILLMSGLAINEPLVTNGPFVMNSQTEILHAMKDYQDGKMGFLYD